MRDPRGIHLLHLSLPAGTLPAHLLVPLPIPPIPDLITSHQCAGNEAEVAARCEYLRDQWENLEGRTRQKTQKLKEANQEQQFNTGVKDMDFWLADVRACMHAHTHTLIHNPHVHTGIVITFMPQSTVWSLATIHCKCLHIISLLL